MENAIDVWALANMANALTQLTWSKSANFLQEHDMENSREDKNPAVTSGTQETDKETAVFLKRIWMRHASDSAHFVRVHQQFHQLFCCWNQWNVARLRSLSAWMIVIHLFLLFRVGGRGGEVVAVSFNWPEDRKWEPHFRTSPIQFFLGLTPSFIVACASKWIVWQPCLIFPVRSN